MSSEWQPIETAPKDGTTVDLWMIDELMEAQYRRPGCAWHKNKWTDFSGVAVEIGPVFASHWMPLPEPPK